MSILGKAKNCEEIKQMSMEGCNMEVSSCDNENCCYDEKLLRVGSEEIKQVINKFDLESITFLNTFFYSYNCLFEGLEENIVPFKNYVTPLIIKDISVLFETFLI